MSTKARIAGPTTKTIAYRLLAALDCTPGGMLADEQLLPLLPIATRSHGKLITHYASLVAWRMVRQLPDGLQILQSGQRYLRQNFAAPVFDALPQPKPANTGSVALPRSAPAFKPLSMDRLMRGKPQRDGMDDYRSVPSLMGSTRVVPGCVK